MGPKANWFQEIGSGSGHNLRAVAREAGAGEDIIHHGWKRKASGPSEERGVRRHKADGKSGAAVQDP